MTRCPLCRAKYRGEDTCHRCQTDLSILLTIEGDAAKLATIAVQHLAAGNLNQAKYYAGKAKKQHATKFHIHLENFIFTQLTR